jgi:3-hydroxyisobutyrate dehydrogenase-like beta-hydroxyacid dehydrogenase
MQLPPVGLIGLGSLGSGLAQRLLGARHAVLGYDADPGRNYLLGALAGKAAASPREVFQNCPRIFLALPDGLAVQEAVYRNADAFQQGLLLIDVSPNDAEPAARLGREVQSRGARYVDATLLGSADQVRTGDVTVICGGETSAVTAARELLSTFARQIHHAGPHGAGPRMKQAITLVLGLHRAVLAEGLAFARRCGLDDGVVLEILRGGQAFSRVMDTKGEKMVARDFTPQTRLSNHLRDVRLIVAEAARSGMRLPLSGCALELLEKVAMMGGGEDDTCAVIRAYD